MLSGHVHVADHELDDSVWTVERVDGDRVAGQVREESEVPPVRPQRRLDGVSQTGAAHHQTPTPVKAFGDLGFTAVGVADRLPTVLVNGPS